MMVRKVFLILFTCFCVQGRTYHTRGSYFPSNTDTQMSIKHYTNPRRFLLELLKSLQKSLQTEINNDDKLMSVSPVYSQADRTKANDVVTQKRGRGDFGIMPPMREMCRMLRIRYCRGHS